MRVKIARCTPFLMLMMSLLLTVHLPDATFMLTTAHADAVDTPVSLDNQPTDASLRRQDEFSCANIQLLTFSVAYDDVGGKIRNTNDQPTRLTRTVVTWDESQLGDTLNPAVVQQRLYYPQTFADVIFWNGFDAVSPTDTSVAAEGSLLPGANLTINPGEDAIWRAYFANTSQLLYYYFWQQDFAGTTLYFDHPTSDEDCAMPVTFVTSPSFYVTTTEDTVDGTCDAAHCSLREAVLALNALSGLDLDRPPRIYVPAGEYRLTRTGVDNGSGQFGDLDVQRDAAIIGEDAETTIIDGMNSDRIFEFCCQDEVILRNVTIRNGQADRGGGILSSVDGLFVLLHAHLTGNAAVGPLYGEGGAISTTDDSGLQIIRTQIDNNSTPNNPQGAAVMMRGSSGRISDSIISDNPASGIAVSHSVYTYIINTTIRDNARAGIDNAYSDVYLYNSTISGNQAGITHSDNFSGSRSYIIQSTVVDNVTGLVKNGPTANFSATNSIIAGNVSSGGQPQNCGSGVAIDSEGYNLIEPVSGCTIRRSSSTDLLDVDPMLGALSDNGGVNETYLPQPGSPVIDMIPVADCLQEPDEGFFSFLPLLNDQRGIRRPQGPACDIGAVETEAPSSNPMVFQVQTSPATADGYLTEGERSGVSPTHFQVIFSRPMYNPPGNSSVNDITSPAQYRLIAGGADSTVQTTACTALQGDDVAVAIDSVTFNTTTLYATLAVNNGVPLANGAYRLFVCASAQDTNRLPLDGNRDGSGGDDFVRSFTVGSAGSDYVVNSVDDVLDWYCGDWQGLCALRGAILLANSSPGTQTIYVPAGTYVLTRGANFEDLADWGDLDIRDDVIIIGEDPETTLIDGNGIDRVFHILNGAHVELYNITLRNGGDVMEGGGILVDDGELTLSNTRVLDNSALQSGGGIATGSTLSQNVTIADSIIRDNQAPLGGGVYHSSTTPLR